MPDGKDYWLKETYRHLNLALIGSMGKSRILIEEVLYNDLPSLETQLEKIINNSIPIPDGYVRHPKFTKYYINREGKVWSAISHRLLKGGITNGYRRYSLYLNSKKHYVFGHILVLETFIGLCPPGMLCRHLDGNPANNNLNNLRWGTCKENSQDAMRHGTSFGLLCGERKKRNKLTEQDVKDLVHLHHTRKPGYKYLADLFNITKDQVYRIVNKKSWKHLWK